MHQQGENSPCCVGQTFGPFFCEMLQHVIEMSSDISGSRTSEQAQGSGRYKQHGQLLSQAAWCTSRGRYRWHLLLLLLFTL